MNDAPPTAIVELRGWDQWVLWRIDAREGKLTKIPLCPRSPGNRASSTDPKTWGPYEATLKPIERGRADGVGFVFTPGDEYFGIDLDHCVVDGVVHPKAMEIVQRMNTYTEFSPSGDGLHIIGRGRVNGDRNRTKKTPWGHDFEVYDQARFFTMTGRQLFGSPATIEARQDELDAICAEMFPAPATNGNGNGHKPVALTLVLDDVALEEKIRSSKQGGRFAQLFDHGPVEGGASEADLALCNILAFWIGPDESRIDSWFRRSALMREKWDAKRGDTTYGGYTIARALDGRTEFYGQKKEGAAPKPKGEETAVEKINRILQRRKDDPYVSGKRYGRKANAHVVFTTRSGAELDLDSWKAATTKPATLVQEVGVQLGDKITLTTENVRELNVLLGEFCETCATMTVDDRARELGVAYLQQAEPMPVDMKNQQARWSAIQRIKNTDPTSIARERHQSIAAASLVIVGGDGRRYVKVQWFIDFVKASAAGSTATQILERMEKVGWARSNSQGKVKFTNPTAGDEPAHLYEVFYEVTRDWEAKDGSSGEVT